MNARPVPPQLVWVTVNAIGYPTGASLSERLARMDGTAHSYVPSSQLATAEALAEGYKRERDVFKALLDDAEGDDSSIAKECDALKVKLAETEARLEAAVTKAEAAWRAVYGGGDASR